MPTLIRLIVALVFLAGLGYGAMFALTIFVDPGVKEVTIKLPPRDLQVKPMQLPEVVTTSEPPPASGGDATLVIPDGPE